jgi:DNA-binding NarL/FixJ family response regulator
MLQGGGRIESDRQTNKLNKKTVEKIIALRQQGLTLEAISNMIGFSKSAVQVHCKQYILKVNATQTQHSVA